MENELEQMNGKTLKSGEICTIAKTKNGYDVDMWDKDGNNRWHRFYVNEKDALVEYNRW